MTFEEWLKTKECDANYGFHRLSEYRTNMCKEVWQASQAQQASVIARLKRVIQSYEGEVSVNEKTIAELVEALEDAKSVINSINRAEMYKLTVEDDDEPVFYQRKEWVDWAYNEILPIVTSAIAKVKGK